MDSAILQAILDELWPELPALLGDDWPDVEQKFLAFREQLDQGELEPSIAQAFIVRELVTFPAAHRRLIELSAEHTSHETTRSADPGAPPTPDAPVRESPAELELITVESQVVNQEVYYGHLSLDSDADLAEEAGLIRYTDILCPRRVWRATPRFAAVVRLTVARPEHSRTTETLTGLQPGALQVQLTAPAFDTLNDARQATEVLADHDSPPLVFDLRPRETGHYQLQFDFYQDGQPLRTATVSVEVTEHQVAEEENDSTQQSLPASTALPPDLVLHIGWNEAERRLEYTLIRDGGAFWRTFQPRPLTDNPAAQAIELYRHITSLAQVEDPTLAALMGERLVIPADDVDRQIRNLGFHLWRTLLPDDFRAFYAADRDQWQNRSLLIYSDEPYLPWELIWPYDTDGGAWQDAGPWCATTRLTRWLRRDAQGNGNEAAPGRLSLRAAAVLAPQYQLLNPLPMTSIERDTLRALFSQRGIEDLGPTRPSWSAVMDLLEGGNFDWFHVAAHGNFYPQSPTGESAIWLEADRALNPQHIEGPTIIQHFRRRRPAFVFNACEVGRQSFALTRIGGWANQLVSLHVGLFIAPQWIVSDGGAATFAATLYRLLLDGETVGAAVQQARLDARSAGDPTWLAYSVYAHPNARLMT